MLETLLWDGLICVGSNMIQVDLSVRAPVGGRIAISLFTSFFIALALSRYFISILLNLLGVERCFFDFQS